MSGKDRAGGLLPVEKALLIYLLITFLYIVFSGRSLDGTAPHLLLRAIGVIVILSWPTIEASVTNRRNLVRSFRIFLPFVILPFLYNETDYLNNVIFTSDLDPIFSHVESSIFNSQPALDFANTFHSGLFADLMYFGYFSYYCLSIGIPLYIYFRVNKQTGERFSFIIIASFLMYYLLYIIVPVAGPQFYFDGSREALPHGFVFGPVMRFISAAGEGRTAAFPSSHVSICLVLLYGCFRYARNLLPVVLPVAVLLLMSTIYLRAHYVIDVMAGILCTPLVMVIAGSIFKKFTRRELSY